MRKRIHRQWRERKGHYGEMLQNLSLKVLIRDGRQPSHDWLEGRGACMVLMGCIDDATNKIFGRFYEYEGTIPAMDCLKRYINRYGLPHSIYIDRHTTYKSNAKPTIEDDLLGRKPMSQFGAPIRKDGSGNARDWSKGNTRKQPTGKGQDREAVQDVTGQAYKGDAS